MLILNFKTYPESTGENCLKLLDLITSFKDSNPQILKYVTAAPSTLDLVYARKTYREINIMAQNVDNKPAGQSTGWETTENLLDNEIGFSLFNHSEHRVWSENIVEGIKTIQSKGLKLVVCCETLEEAEILLQANSFGIAYEPKDLIGGDVSVTTRPEVVSKFVEKVKGKTMVFIGAGIHLAEDVKKGLELGAEGFIISSAFVKAEHPKEKLIELTTPFLH